MIASTNSRHPRRCDASTRVAFLRQAVVPAAALAGFFDPASVDPAALLQAVQQRIERCDAEFHRAGGAVLDQLADVVPVAGLVLDERKDHQLRAAFFQLRILHHNILYRSIWTLRGVFYIWHINLIFLVPARR